jgi:hypothetical protein
VGIDSNSTIPVESNKSPCKWARDNWDVNESRMCIVAEIEGRQVEEIDNQNNFSPDEMSSNKEHDEGKLQEVVEDEVASNTCGSLNMFTVLREEMP